MEGLRLPVQPEMWGAPADRHMLRAQLARLASGNRSPRLAPVLADPPPLLVPLQRLLQARRALPACELSAAAAAGRGLPVLLAGLLSASAAQAGQAQASSRGERHRRCSRQWSSWHQTDRLPGALALQVHSKVALLEVRPDRQQALVAAAALLPALGTQLQRQLGGALALARRLLLPLQLLPAAVAA